MSDEALTEVQKFYRRRPVASLGHGFHNPGDIDRLFDLAVTHAVTLPNPNSDLAGFMSALVELLAKCKEADNA